MFDSTPRRCSRCGVLKAATDFYLRKNAGNTCRACHRARSVARYAAFRQYTDTIKLERGCADCGYNAHAVALQFDHLPGFEKSHGISEMVVAGGVTFESLDEEIAKCEVVCANCHSVRTHVRKDYSSANYDLRAAGLAASAVVTDPQMTLDDLLDAG